MKQHCKLLFATLLALLSSGSVFAQDAKLVDAAKKEGGKAPQAFDDGSEESKFQPRLRDSYREKVVPALMKEFGYKNVMQVPKLERIVLNVGMSEAIQNVKLLESAATELGTITAQRAPFVVLTSNATRELSEALKRRFYPQASIDMGKETVEWAKARMPRGPRS